MNAEKIVTDDSYLEQRKHGEASFPFRYYEEDVWQFDAHNINWHWHREIEMIFAARGDILCDVGADSFVLKEGCGLFVNSGVLHRYAAEGSVCMPNILFLPELLGEEGGRIYEKYVAPVIREGAEYLLLQPGEGGQNEPLYCFLFLKSKNMAQTNSLSCKSCWRFGGYYATACRARARRTERPSARCSCSR